MDRDICNDTTLYACDKNLNNIIARLENDSSITIQWFADNFMKLNSNKCNLLILGKSSNQQVKVNSTGFSSYEFVFGRVARAPVELDLGLPIESDKQRYIIKRLKTVIAVVHIFP